MGSTEQTEQTDGAPMDVLTRLTIALEAMNARTQVGPASPQYEDIIAKLTQALERQADVQLKGAELIAQETRRAHRPSNEVVPLRSVLNPRGVLLPDYTKPILRCPTFLPWVADDDSLTREEVELANLLEPGEFTVKRVDGSTVKLAIQVDTDLTGEKASRVVISHEAAFKSEFKSLMPPLADFLRQMLKQSKKAETKRAAAGILTMDEENALIEAGELSVSK